MIRFRQKFVKRTRCDETMNLTKPSCGTQITPRASKASMRPAQNGLLAIRGHTLANSKNMPIRQRRSAQMHAFSCMHPLHASSCMHHKAQYNNKYNRRITQCAYMYKQCHASTNNTRTIHTRTIQYKGSGPGQRETGRS